MGVKLVIGLLAIVGAALVQAKFQSVDYCNKDLCKDPSNPYVVKQHIACTNNKGFGGSCGGNRQELPMDDKWKKIILDAHNSARSRLASGKLPNYQSCDRMLEMEWDDELAHIAAFNARKCQFQHDECRNTKDYPYSGQNIAMLQSSSGYIDDRTAIERMFNMWFDEYKYCNMHIINSYRTPGGPDIGHFTQIANSKSNKVGCAVVKWATNMYKTYFVCNYALTNINQQPIFTTGSPCSKCTKGCSSSYPGLCHVNENQLVSPTPNGYKGGSSSTSSSSTSSTSHTSHTSSSSTTYNTGFNNGFNNGFGFGNNGFSNSWNTWGSQPQSNGFSWNFGF